MRVRIPPSALWCRRFGGSALADRRRNAPVPVRAACTILESEPAGGRASLLTRARLRAWRSCLPLSALDDEPGRVLAPVGNRAVLLDSMGIVCSVIRHGL
jgi:hypothetical protein